MPKRDPRVDKYIENAAPFARPILKHLRKIVHAGCPQAQETIKWGFPHFEHHGIMCNMAGFTRHCAFGFWKGELIFGDNGRATEAMGHFGRITSISDLPDDRSLIRHVKKAAALNESGVKRPGALRPPKKAAKVPGYFATALKKNSKANRTFANFSPSHRREYIEWLTSAKRAETRERRLQTAIEWLGEGKVHNWKHLR